MSQLSYDIIETHILSRLPIDSLPKFKLVCKSFHAHISSSEFIQQQLCRSMSTNTDRLVIISLTRNGLDAFELNSLVSPSFYLPLPKPFNLQTVCIIGSCNGLLCIGTISGFHRYDTMYEIMLLNPFTGMHLKVSPLITPTQGIGQYDNNYRLGFGFDDWTQDYKIVAIFGNIATRVVMVYSLRANSWNTIALPTRFFRSQFFKNPERGVLIDNHLLHWVFTDEGRHRYWIGCFDLRTENWVDDVALPHECDNNLGDLHDMETLGVFDGHLCLLVPTNDTVDMWVMKVYGVKQSWVKVYYRLHNPGETPGLRLCPIGSHEHELLLVRGNSYTHPYPLHGRERDALVWYNMTNQETRMSEIHKDHRHPQNVYDVFTCVKSLVPLPGGSFIPKFKQTLPQL